MDEAEVISVITRYLTATSTQCGTEIAMVPESLSRHSFGWSFVYQSQTFLDTNDFSQMLVGQGPVVILRDGRILQGGSLDANAEAVLRRFNIAT